MPKNTCPKRTKSWNGIQTYADRKYSFTAVQMPSSTCASVPQKTSTRAKENKTTVSRSDARAASAFLNGPLPGRCGLVGALAALTVGGLPEARTALLLMFA